MNSRSKLPTLFLKNSLLRPGLGLALAFCFFLGAGEVWGQIAQRGTATTATSTSNTLTITKPTDLEVGDLMIATIGQSNNEDNDLGNASLTGWTLIHGQQINPGSPDDRWWGTFLYKIADATDVAATNFTFNVDNDSENSIGAIIVFLGVDNSSPFEEIGTFTSGDADNLSANSISNSSVGAGIVMLGIIEGNRTFSGWNTDTPGPGALDLNELFEIGSTTSADMAIGGAWALKNTMGSTGIGDSELSGNNNSYFGSILLALKPCTVPTGTLSGTQTICVGGTTTFTSTVSGGTWSSSNTGVATINPTTGVITGVSAGTATMTYTVTGSCGTGTVTRTVTVNAAPSGLNYTNNAPVYCLNQAISANAPSISGGSPATSYSVSPSLPTGLTLNTSTGQITGTPSASQAATNYTITATNSCGSTTRVLSITITLGAPTGLSYSNNGPLSLCVGQALTANNPTSGGGIVGSYSVSPALPAGLTLNTSTGQITGTPTAVSAATNYTITASNSCGSTTRVINIAVGGAPTALNYTNNGPLTYCTGVAISNNNATASGGSAATSFSISPALPAGLSFDTSTGRISGTPTGASASTNYTITATNSCGSITRVLTIAVTAPPSGLNYTNNTVTYCVNQSISTNSPTLAGGVPTSFSVSPALPAGLTLNTTTGEITGTPTTVSAAANYTVTATNSCGNTTRAVNIRVNPVSEIDNISAISCSGTAFTVTPVNGTNGVVLASTTYTWSAPVVTGGMTGGAASSGTPSSITGNLINPTNIAQSATYTVTPVTNGCAGTPFTVLVLVNPSAAINPINTSICSDGSFTITPADGTNGRVPADTQYSWTAPAMTGGLTGGIAGSGTSITGTLKNNTNTPQTATYTVTPLTGSCVGANFTVTVTVNPKPAITPMTGATCSNQPFTITPANSTNGLVPAGTTYSWTLPSLPAGITGGAAGSGASITGTLINTTNGPLVATYTVTPTSGTCVGDPFTVAVTVNPTPVIPTQTPTICSTTAFTVSPTNGGATIVPAGTTYTWTVIDNPNVTGESNQASAQPSISQTLTNTSTIPQTVTYTVTPVSGAAGNCPGQPFNITVTVNPTPVLTSETSLTRCSNESGTYTATSATPGTTFSWTRGAVAGISNPAGSGSTATATETLINTTSNPIDVTYIYTLTANGCTNTQSVVVKVFPTPTLSSTQTPPAICSNSAFTYTPTSNVTGTTFTWTRAAIAGISNPAVTTPQTSNPNEALVNTTAAPIDVIYTYTLTANGCSNTQSVTVRVNPTPTLSSSLTPSAVCSNSAFSYTPTSGTSGATFTWTRAAVTGISNPAVTTPQSAAPNEALINTTDNPVTVVYTFTISANGCSNTQNVNVVVNPTPTLSSTLTPAAICSNSAFTYTPTSNTSGATFTWTRATVSGISNPAVTTAQTSNPNELLINTTDAPINVVYAYAISANGCTNTQNVTVTVNPTPRLNSTLTPPAICSNTAFTYTPTSLTSGATFFWTRAAVPGISNPAITGPQTSNPNETLINTTANPIQVVYAFTTTANGCSNTENVTVTVNPTPALSSSLNPSAICSGTAFAYTPTSATPGATFTWTRSAVGGITNMPVNTPQSGSLNEVLVNATPNPIDVVYAITITANGCSATQNVTVRVNPEPKLSSETNLERCNNVSATYTAESATTGTTFSWSRAAVAGISNPAGSGSGAAVTETLINTTANPIDVVYVYTMTANGCTSSQNVTVKVNPTLGLSSPINSPPVCSNTPFSYLASSATTGATITWTRAAVAGISNAAVTTPQPSPIGETLVNTTSSPIDVIYRITITLNGCSNTIEKTVKVIPSPKIDPIAASSCTGQPFTITPADGTNGVVPAGTTYTWSTPTVTGGITGGAGGSGSSITGTLINAGTTPQTATYQVTPVSAGCTGTPFSVVVTVNPNTAITTQPSTANFEICFGDGFSPVSVTAIGGNLTYQWYSNSTASNSGGTAVTGATSASFTPPSTTLGSNYYYVEVTGACGVVVSQVTGEYAVKPAITEISTDLNTAPQTICPGDSFSPLAIVALGADLKYQWYSNTTASNSGGTLISGATSASFTPPSNVAGPVYYYVLASSKCGTVASSVSGAFSITQATSTAPNQTLCVDEALSPVITHSTTGTTGIGAATGLPPGVTATWANNVITISGTPTSSAGSPYNYSIALIGACGTQVATGTITVNPKAIISNKVLTVCSEEAFSITPADATIPAGTTYAWNAPAVTGGITGGVAGTGTAISGTLSNPTNAAQTATYTVTATSGECVGASFTVTVTVNPKPIIPAQTATICSGDQFTVTPANGGTTIVPAGTTYTWTVADNPNVTGESAQASAQNSISQTLTNTSNVPQIVTYTVTPLSGTCTGATFTVTVTVNPAPVIPALTAEACSGSAFTVSPSNGGATIVPAGTTYTWTVVDNPNVTGEGNQASAQSTISQTLTNTTNIPQTVVYTVTPTSGAAGTCAGASFTVTVTVNPSPIIPNQTDTICSGATFTVSPVHGGTTLIPSGTTYTWTVVDNPNVSGESAQVTAQGTISQTLTNTSSTPQNVVYTVTPRSGAAGTCVGEAFSVTVTVNPIPTLSSTLNPAEICSNTAFTYTPTSATPGASFTWTRAAVAGISNAAVTSAQTGALNETLINTTPNPVDVVYAFTITAGGCSNTQNVTVRVKPTPTLSSPITPAAICSNTPFTYTPSSATNGATFTWTRAAVTGISNPAVTTAQTSNPNETLINTTNAPINVVYVFAITANGCSTTQNVTVTVNPRPELTSTLTPAEICSNTAFSYTPNANIAGSTFTWTRAAVAGISNSAITSAQSGAINETLINTTANSINVVYAITVSANGCSNTQNVTVTVKPTPTLSSTTSPAAICSNTAFTYTPSSAVAGVTYTWTRPAVAGISNPTVTTPQSSNPNETLINTTNAPVDVTYIYTLTANGCSNTQNVTVRVNPTPTLSSTLTPAAVCTGTPFTYTATSATTGPVTYSWSRATVAGISNAAGSGSTASINETLTNTTADPITVTYAVTVTANGCSNTQNVTVTVNPRPAITPASIPITICSGDTFSFTPANGTNGIVPSGTTYSWGVPTESGGTVTGRVAGSGSSISATLSHTGTSARTVTYTITPTSGTCAAGPTFQVVVTVNPIPSMNAVTSPAAVCAGATVPAINFSGSGVAGTTYTWTNSNPSIGLAASGTGNISAFTAINEGVAQTTATITVTPVANGCSGPSRTFTITVNPTPKVTIVPDYCAVGGKVQLVAFSNVPGTTWLWNTGQTSASILVDLSGNYSVTATAGGCSTVGTIAVAQELVVDGSFTNFNPASPSFITEYNQNQAFYVNGNGATGLWPEGNYAVNVNANGTTTTTPPGYHTNFFGRDHTNNATGARNFMMVNGATSTIGNPPRQRIIWQQTVTIEPNTDYYFSAWAMNLNPSNPAELQFEVNGVLVGTIADLDLAPKPTSNAQVNLNNWVRFYSDPTWNSGTATTAVIRIRNLNLVAGGNDFALDDISFGTLSPFIVLTSGAGTDNQTVCQDSPITDITYKAGSSIIGPTVTGLPPGITPIWNGVTLRFSGSPTAAGTFDYTITTSGLCAPATANGRITVRATPTAGSIAANQTVCVGQDPATLSSTTAGTGEIGSTITYRWESNTNLTSPNWTAVAGQSGATYDPPVLSVTTQYRRITIATLGGLSCESQPTSPVTITIQNTPTAGSIAGAQTICNGGDASGFTSTNDGSGEGSLSYRWESAVSPFTSWTTISGATTATYDAPAGLTSTTQFRRVTISTLNGTACESVPTAPIEVTVNSIPTAGAIAASQTICSGQDPASFSSTTDGTGSGSIFYRWESSVSPFSTWSTISGATSSTYDVPAGLTATTQYRRITLSTLNGVTCESVPTAAVEITVNPTNTITPVDPDPHLCLNTISPLIITHTVTGATGIVPQSGTVNYNLPNGITPELNGGVLTISGTPTEFGVFNYSIPLSGGCGSVSATGTITVENPSYPITSINVVNPTSLPGSSTFTVFSPNMTPGTYEIRYSTNGINGGVNNVLTTVVVATSGQFTFTSPAYSNEGSTVLTINSIQRIIPSPGDPCPYFPPNNNTAVYGFGCSSESLQTGGNDVFYVPAGVFELRIQSFGDGSSPTSSTVPVIPGGTIFIGVVGNTIFATKVPLATATPADYLVSAIGPNGRIVINYECTPPPPCSGTGNVFQYTDSEGFTVIRITGDCSSWSWIAPDGLDEFEVMVVGGGGGGGFGEAAGGGGGGAVVYRQYLGITMNGLPGLQNATFTITPGNEGLGATSSGVKGGTGGDSFFSGPTFNFSGGNTFTNLMALGGGGGGSSNSTASIREGGHGASGGGGAAHGAAESNGGTGTDGSNGGNGMGETSTGAGGGGGGMSSTGGNAISAGGGILMTAGSGGNGEMRSISGENIFYGAGGGGTASGSITNVAGAGGSAYTGPTNIQYHAGGNGNNNGLGQTATTYGSGGGAGRTGGASGFRGVVYIRYPNFRILNTEYLYFNAVYNTSMRSGDLNWATTKEWENDRFEVERSVNTVSNWEKIGELPAAGNSDGHVKYDFKDMKLPLSGGNIFYRLKQIDFSGAYSYSVTKAIQVEPMEGVTQWRVYPNPTTGYPFDIELINPEIYQDETITLRVISATGKFETFVFDQIETMGIKVSDWFRTQAAGIYTLEISWGEQREYHKVILRR